MPNTEGIDYLRLRIAKIQAEHESLKSIKSVSKPAAEPIVQSDSEYYSEVEDETKEEPKTVAASLNKLRQNERQLQQELKKLESGLQGVKTKKEDA